jgi:hypothetical protein
MQCHTVIAMSLECQLVNVMPESSHWFWNLTETLDADLYDSWPQF